MCPVERFIVTIEASTWQDVDEIELLTPPDEGEPIETKYGTCTVTRVDLLPDSANHAGNIICRFP
jgi:hypothetical protein